MNIKQLTSETLPKTLKPHPFQFALHRITWTTQRGNVNHVLQEPSMKKKDLTHNVLIVKLGNSVLLDLQLVLNVKQENSALLDLQPVQIVRQENSVQLDLQLAQNVKKEHSVLLDLQPVQIVRQENTAQLDLQLV